MSRIKRAMGLAQDFPRLVNGALLAAVVLYWLSTALWWPAASVARSLDAATGSDHLMTLHLGVAAVAAMVAGFSGVVVVFGLSGETERFRRLRAAGGDRLHANRISVVGTSFAGAFLSLVCAGLAISQLDQLSVWVGLYAVLLPLHGSVRLVWLLQALALVVKGEDDDRKRAEATVSTSELFPRRAG